MKSIHYSCRVLLFLISQGIIEANIFSNPYELQKLYGRFLQIGKDIENLEFTGKDILLKNCNHFWLDIYSGSYQPFEDKILDNLVSNPIHNFQLFQSTDLIDTYLRPFLQKNSENETYRVLYEKLREIPASDWPTENDYHENLDGFLRVINMYQLPITDLAKGLIKNRQTNAHLSPDDIIFLENEVKAKYAIVNQQLYPAYYLLCREGSMVPIKETCAFQHGNDPWLRLGPIKTEVISKEPSFPLVLYHDVLSPDQMNFMKSEARRTLAKAELYNAADESKDLPKLPGRMTNERTQSSGWLWELDHEELVWLSKRLEAILKLKVVSKETYVWASEAYQVGVYTPGGVFVPHTDALEPLDSQAWSPNGTWIGNRIATAMFYLSDVDGGATVFPNLGLAVNPVKGSMLFWYSLSKEGNSAKESMHGGCPTMHGLKWVSNKWIREGEQMFHRKC